MRYHSYLYIIIANQIFILLLSILLLPDILQKKIESACRFIIHRGIYNVLVITYSFVAILV